MMDMKKILVAEDQTDIRNLLVLNLRGAGYQVTEVADGLAALASETARANDLLVLDLMMPGMDGLELCKTLRARGCSTPILMLTAKSTELDRVLGLELGADDYLTKPFAFVELSARVRALLRRDANADKLVVTVGALRIDSLAVAVTVSGHPLSMSPKEFALLRLLAGTVGEVVSRSRILEEVWGSTENIDPNIVDQYVSYLRRKLEPVLSGVRIVTKRGSGYLLEPVA